MTVHVPILVEQIISSFRELLENQTDRGSFCLVDCTFGGGGHASSILQMLSELGLVGVGKLVAFDRDLRAVKNGEKRFEKEVSDGTLEIIHSCFSEARAYLSSQRVLGIVADLGVSSDQLENQERGMSFRSEGPLDMRMNSEVGESCFEFLSRVGEEELADIIFENGEERFSRRIASGIIRAREEGRLENRASGLSEIIFRAVPSKYRYGRIHPATRTFQALRIVINEELKELDALLNDVILSLEPGGRVAILSFHSLEDRKVKRTFRDRNGPFRSLHKKPIQPDNEEVGKNPRSRSAKLRIAERK